MSESGSVSGTSFGGGSLTLRQHKGLTPERWDSFPFYQQLLMIANELNRARHWIEYSDSEESRLCLERALELIVLTILTLRDRTRLRELLIAKEYLCYLHSSGSDTRATTDLMHAVVSLDPRAFNMLTPP